MSFLILAHLLAFPINMSEAASNEKPIIKKGDYFPEIPLSLPADSRHLTYLGISKGDQFTIKDIQADLIWVEIMHINCSSCQRQAPINNKLYDLIESTPETKGRIKMLAIAVGCLDIYIQQFVDHFKTPYPVIQDPKFLVYDAVGRTPTPLDIYLRKNPETGAWIVAGTHLGFDSDYQKMFQEIQRLMNVDFAAILDEGKKIKAKSIKVKPILSETELQKKIKTAFEKEGSPISKLKKIELQNGQTVYSSVVRQDGQKKIVLAAMVMHPSPCDVCHEVHFIYVLEGTGKILQFIPVQLTKYGNKHWDDRDVEKMRKSLVGRYILMPFDFDPAIDAVTSATITSSVIFRSLEEEQGVLRELKEKGLLQIPTDDPKPNESEVK